MESNLNDNEITTTAATKDATSLDKLDIRILLIIDLYSTNKEICRKLKEPKWKISRRMTKLCRIGLLKKTGRFFGRKLKGTIACCNFLTLYEKNELIIRTHNMRFKSKIVRAPEQLQEKLLKSNWVEHFPNNWTGYRKRIFNCYVLFTPKNVQYILPEIYARTSEQAIDSAVKLVLNIKESLEDEFKGFVLGKPEEVTTLMNQHYANQFDPLALEHWKYKQTNNVTLTYKSDRLNIDFSKGVPELETVHKVHAKDDINKITKFYEDMIRTDFDLNDFLEVQKYQLKFQQITAENFKAFAIAMREHLALIKSLQKVSQSLQDVIKEIKHVKNS